MSQHIACIQTVPYIRYALTPLQSNYNIFQPNGPKVSSCIYYLTLILWSSRRLRYGLQNLNYAQTLRPKMFSKVSSKTKKKPQSKKSISPSYLHLFICHGKIMFTVLKIYIPRQKSSPTFPRGVIMMNELAFYRHKKRRSGA